MASVSLWEFAIWSGMAGAIALMCLIAATDLLIRRTLSALRALVFILTMGGTAILLSGLPEILAPTLDPATLLPFKIVGGPLSGALGLTYLGIWIEAAHDDARMRWVVGAGSGALVLTAGALALLWFGSADGSPGDFLMAAAAANVVGLLVGALVATRGALLGDRLARGMVLACGLLLMAAFGLYAKDLGLMPGPIVQALTAVAMVGHFSIGIALTQMRNRELRRLHRLAAGAVESRIDLHLPQGSLLVPRIEEAIWRSERYGRDCVIAAVSVRNLYELGEVAGHGVEAQILSVLAARIRRQVGFRNVVGLYHPRCFVLAVSAGQDPRRGELVVSRLLRAMQEEVRVSSAGLDYAFSPRIGVGVVRMNAERMDALDAINRAEQRALDDHDDYQLELALNAE